MEQVLILLYLIFFHSPKTQGTFERNLISVETKRIETSIQTIIPKVGQKIKRSRTTHRQTTQTDPKTFDLTVLHKYIQMVKKKSALRRVH